MSDFIDEVYDINSDKAEGPFNFIIFINLESLSVSKLYKNTNKLMSCKQKIQKSKDSIKSSVSIKLHYLIFLLSEIRLIYSLTFLSHYLHLLFFIVLFMVLLRFSRQLFINLKAKYMLIFQSALEQLINEWLNVQVSIYSSLFYPSLF